MYKSSGPLVLIAAGSIVAPMALMAQLLPAAALSNLSSAEVSGCKNAIVLVGGMMGGGMPGGMMGRGMPGGMMGGSMPGGMMGGGMPGGMMGGGMPGGMMGGGMPGGMMGGGMTGMMGGGMSGGSAAGGAPVDGGMNAYGADSRQSYDTSQTSDDGAQPAKYYTCLITQYGQCSVASSGGPLRRGASCLCPFGRQGEIQ